MRGVRPVKDQYIVDRVGRPPEEYLCTFCGERAELYESDLQGQ